MWSCPRCMVCFAKLKSVVLPLGMAATALMVKPPAQGWFPIPHKFIQSGPDSAVVFILDFNNGQPAAVSMAEAAEYIDFSPAGGTMSRICRSTAGRQCGFHMKSGMGNVSNRLYEVQRFFGPAVFFQL